MQKFVYDGNTVEAESYDAALIRYREMLGVHPDNFSIADEEGDYVFLANSADTVTVDEPVTDIVPNTGIDEFPAVTPEAESIPLDMDTGNADAS